MFQKKVLKDQNLSKEIFLKKSFNNSELIYINGMDAKFKGRQSHMQYKKSTIVCYPYMVTKLPIWFSEFI